MAEFKYGIWDTKNNSWVRNKEYDSLKSANRAVDRLDNEYGGSRYVHKVLPAPAPMTPEKTSSSDESFDDGQIVAAKKGGMIKSASRRGDGIAIKGKTRGRLL